MLRAARLVVVVALAGLAVTLTGCSSSNKGKIEGKWKVVSGPGLDAQIKEMEQLKAYMYFDFRGDGSLTIGAESSDPAIQELAAKNGKTVTCKYKLRGGESVEFYDLPPEMKQGGGGLFGGKDKARTNVTINGDSMTMKDSDGSTAKLTKVK
jgi:hypothetical protein